MLKSYSFYWALYCNHNFKQKNTKQMRVGKNSLLLSGSKVFPEISLKFSIHKCHSMNFPRPLRTHFCRRFSTPSSYASTFFRTFSLTSPWNVFLVTWFSHFRSNSSFSYCVILLFLSTCSAACFFCWFSVVWLSWLVFGSRATWGKIKLNEIHKFPKLSTVISSATNHNMLLIKSTRITRQMTQIMCNVLAQDPVFSW